MTNMPRLYRIAQRATVVAVIAFLVKPAVGADNIRTVALWPQPEIAGAQISLRPEINDNGQVAVSHPPFQTHWNNPELDAADGFGIFAEGLSGLQPIVVPGEQPPVMDPLQFQRLGSTSMINDHGDLVFWSFLRGNGIDSSNNNGIFTSDATGALRLVAREGDTVPGHPELTFDYLGTPTTNYQLTDHGQVSFTAKVIGPDFDTHANIWGIFTETGSGELRMVARLGQQIPGEPAGTTFGFVGRFRVNDAGQVLFGNFQRDPTAFAVDYDLFLEADNGLQTIASSGDPAPGASDNRQFGRLSDWELNQNGGVAFVSELDGGDPAEPHAGVFRFRNGAVEPVAISGQPAGAGMEFGNSYATPVLNDQGQIAFIGSQRPAGSTLRSNRAYFTEASGSGLRAAAVVGSPAPGTGPGVTFEYFHITPQLSNEGHLFFGSTLTGPGVDSSNRFGIFVETLGTGVQLVARTGDLLNVSDDPEVADYRTIRELGDGFHFSSNDAGEVAFAAEFTDGTYGIFVAQAVPEPATNLTLLASLMFLASRLRRRPTRATYRS